MPQWLESKYDTDSKSEIKFPKWATKALKYAAGQATESASNLRELGPYEGPFLAQPAEYDFQAVTQQEELANQLQGQDFLSQMLPAALASARGDMLRPESNPYLQANLDALQTELLETQGLQDQMIQSEAIAQGAYGGSANAVARAQLAEATQETLGQSINDYLLRNYMAERQFQVGAPEWVDAILAASSGPAAASAQAGAARRAMEQIPLEEGKLLFGEEVAAEMRPLQALELLTGLPFPSTTTTTGSALTAMPKLKEQKQDDPSWWRQALGGILGIGGLGSLAYLGA